MTILLDRPSAGTRVLRLHSPANRNALDEADCAALRDAVDEITRDPAARAVVVAGTGPAFCAGADLPAVFGGPRVATAAMRERLRSVYASFLSLRTLAVPTIAAVDGPAVGAGMNVALSCDIIFASPRASFSAAFTRLGLHPGGGATAFLVEALGRQRAFRFLLEGGELTADAAMRLGLVESVHTDPLQAALYLARHIETLGPQLARDMKTAVRLALAGDFGATVEFEGWAQAASTDSPALARAVARRSLPVPAAAGTPSEPSGPAGAAR